MLPITEIKEGDLFTNPLYRNCFPMGNVYRVEKVNVKEKMVCIQCYGGSTMEPFLKPFWKKNTDRMFCENWRLE